MKKMSLLIGFLGLVLSVSCVQCNGGGTGGSNAVAAPVKIALVKVTEGLSQPTCITHAGDGSGRLFVAERAGRIKIVKDGLVLAVPFLDISGDIRTSGSEQGMLGLAFPPGYADKGYFYVNYTRSSDGSTVVSRFHITADPDVADSGSEEVLLTQEQPFSNHNGGQLAFGPDGFLYIGLGDGGSGGDPEGNGQSTDTLLGKLLRLDVESGASPYAIPLGNPLAGAGPGLDEIWAYGLRNPWRFSFDRATGDLFIADVGQSRYEEIDYQPSASTGGENYGWNIMEGFHCFESPDCDKTGVVLPVFEYANSGADCSVTGGYVYQGVAYPALQGIYLFGDFCSGRLRGLRAAASGFEGFLFMDSDLSISTFGEDEAGEIYVADYGTGTVYRVTAL